MRTCPSCGHFNDDDATSCAFCGSSLPPVEEEPAEGPISAAKTPAVSSNPDEGRPFVGPDQPPEDFDYSTPFGDGRPERPEGPSERPAANGGQVPSTATGSGLATASLVLGIISIVICLLVPLLSPVGVVLGIIGIVLATLAKRRGVANGIRMGGFVTSLIGLILSVIEVVACACLFSVARTTLLALLSESLDYYETGLERAGADVLEIALGAGGVRLLRS